MAAVVLSMGFFGQHDYRYTTIGDNIMTLF